MSSQAGAGHATPPIQPAGAESRSTCVLWHDPLVPPPPQLLHSFKKHGAAILSCTDPYTMLAHACRVTAGKGGRTESRHGAVLLVLVQPERLRGVVELATTVRRYVPASVLWYFDGNAADWHFRELKIVIFDFGNFF